MTESLKFILTEIVPDILLSATIWAAILATAGFFLGWIAFFTIRAFKGYNFQIKWRRLIKVGILFYTVGLFTFFFGSAGIVRGISSEIEQVMSRKDTHEHLVSSLSNCCTQATAAAIVISKDVAANGELKMSMPQISASVDAFTKEEWGLDAKKTSEATRILTGKILDDNYDKFYEIAFKKSPSEDSGASKWFCSKLLDWGIERYKKEMGSAAKVAAVLAEVDQMRKDKATESQLKARHFNNFFNVKISKALSSQITALLKFEQNKLIILAFLLAMLPTLIIYLLKLIHNRFGAKTSGTMEEDLEALVGE